MHSEVLIVVFLFVIVLVGLATIRSILETRQKEQTKREIAAYIAEGTMTPETAEAILGKKNTDDARGRILQMVEDGTIDADEAAQLVKSIPDIAKPTPA
jgi:hypothetical protein